MKKVLGAALAALMLVGGSAIATAKEWTKVRIATEGAYAPFNYVTPDGELAGFDVDAAVLDLEADPGHHIRDGHDDLAFEHGPVAERPVATCQQEETSGPQ